MELNTYHKLVKRKNSAHKYLSNKYRKNGTENPKTNKKENFIELIFSHSNLLFKNRIFEIPQY